MSFVVLPNGTRSYCLVALRGIGPISPCGMEDARRYRSATAFVKSDNLTMKLYYGRLSDHSHRALLFPALLGIDD